MEYQVSNDEIQKFKKDGIICLRGVFNSDQVEKLQGAAEFCMAAPSSDLSLEIATLKEKTGRFFHDTFIWQNNSICHDFVHNSQAAGIAGQLMSSSKCNVLFDQWLIKEPGTDIETPWHHDLPYWPVLGEHVCTMWLALDAVSHANGAVEYIRGSHRWGERLKPVTFSGKAEFSEDLEPVPDIEADRNDYDIVHFELEPGDCTIHHGLLVHHAPGNTMVDTRRRAYVTRWTGDDAEFYPHDGIQQMPPLPDIQAGAPMDSDLWPVVWQR